MVIAAVVVQVVSRETVETVVPRVKMVATRKVGKWCKVKVPDSKPRGTLENWQEGMAKAEEKWKSSFGEYSEQWGN